MNGHRASPAVPWHWVRLWQALLAVGVVAFLAALVTGNGQRAWQAYHVNFLFWTGIAQGGIVFSAAYRVSKGQWGEVFRRMGESLAFFLPVSFVLFLILMAFGAHTVFPWVRTPVPGKELWLSVPFLTFRNALALLILFGLSLTYVYYSQRATLRGDSACQSKAVTLSPALLIAFGLGFSLLAFDLVMPLVKGWYSSLLGLYFFVDAFYAVLAFLTVAAFLFRRVWQLQRHLTADRIHDLGRLLFGICLLTGGLFWAQWLVVWYGNLPAEIHPVLRQFYQMPYGPFAWTMAYGAFLVPLAILLSKPLKRNPAKLMAVGVWILAMLWIEKYLWVAPFVYTGKGAPIVIELLITAGFAGGFFWGWTSYSRRFPIHALLP